MSKMDFGRNGHSNYNNRKNRPASSAHLTKPAPEEPITRTDRPADALRPIEIIPQCNKWAEGSCLIKWGDTQVLCTASIEEKVPLWVKGTGMGWVTAEYGMLPRSTDVRMEREAKLGLQQGRTQEIQRLIGRALRGCVNLRALDGLTVKIDCDVLQADGGTRTASVTGGFVALYLAMVKLASARGWAYLPIRDFISAVSCGIVNRTPLLDLDFREDSHAETDANFVMNARGGIIEVQGTAEKTAFTADEYIRLLTLAQKAMTTLFQKQKEALEKALGAPVIVPEIPLPGTDTATAQDSEPKVEVTHDNPDSAGNA